MEELSSQDMLAIELARCREYVRSTFPTLAHPAYGEAQQDFKKVNKYIKAVFYEATKKGLIESPSAQK